LEGLCGRVGAVARAGVLGASLLFMLAAKNGYQLEVVELLVIFLRSACLGQLVVLCMKGQREGHTTQMGARPDHAQAVAASSPLLRGLWGRLFVATAGAVQARRLPRGAIWLRRRRHGCTGVVATSASL